MEELKITYDECLSEPVVEALRPFLQKSGIKLVVQSVVAYQRSGVPDKIWIPKLAAEGGWIVISADRGKKHVGEKYDEKLPYLCRLHRVTHVLMSGTVHNAGGFIKGQAVIAVWQEITEAAQATPGTRFSLRKKDRGDGYLLVNADVEHGERRKRQKSPPPMMGLDAPLFAKKEPTESDKHDTDPKPGQ